eukprot:586789-Rhodomonas_salina.1
MSGTDIAYRGMNDATQCPVLTYRMLLPGEKGEEAGEAARCCYERAVLCDVRYCTDIGYAATRRAVLTWGLVRVLRLVWY